MSDLYTSSVDLSNVESVGRCVYETDPMDSAAKYVKALRERAGLSMDAAAKLAGFSYGSGWQRYEKDETYTGITYLRRDVVEKLAKALVGRGSPPITVSEVWDLAGLSPQSTGEIVMEKNSPANSSHEVSGRITYAPGAPSLDGPRDLKILGHAKAGSDGWFIDNGEVVGMAVRPHMLVGVPDAYAVYCQDDSMYPAFLPGCLIFVDDKRPANPGNDVIIQLHDGQAFVKQLKRRTEKHLICWQWNPAVEVKFDRSRIKAVHLIVDSHRVRT